MARINLSIDDDLFDLLKEDAEKHNCTVNVYLITLLEKLYKQNPFNYQAALETLEKEAKNQPFGKEFTLVDLPSFSEISVVKAEDANLKPSIVRARLGKMFNSRVRDKKVGDVIRQLDENGDLKFISRSAVYTREKKINCDNCNYSKYAGYSHLDNSEETCLLFLDKKLDKREDVTTKPCEECNGKYFKEDEC